MAAHSSIPAWIIPWTEEPDRLQSVGSQRVRQDTAAEHILMYLVPGTVVHTLEIQWCQNTINGGYVLMRRE